MAENVGNIAITVGANVADFVTDMGSASGAVTGLDKKAREMMNTLVGYGLAATAAGAAVIAGLYVTASETIDRQAKLARALGSTTAGIQSLEYAADMAGVAHEELSAATGKLNQKLGQAMTVGGAAAKELNRLGLSAQELSKMDANERMATIADRMVALGYNSQQAAASLKELGLKGNNVVAMMMDGGDQFRAANAELRELNVLVSDTDASKIEAANDAWSKTKMVIVGLANTIAVQLSPYMRVIAEYLRNAAVESGGFKEQVSAAIKSALGGFAKLGDVIQGLRVVFKGIELVAVAFGAAVVSVFEMLLAPGVAVNDLIIKGINSAITASNKLLGTSHELIALPGESAFMTGLHDLGEAARNKVSELRTELGELAMQEMPSDKIKKYLEDVAAMGDPKNFKGPAGSMPAENEEDAKKKEKANNVMDSLRAGTESMRVELDKRREIIAIYRNNQLAADAPYYAQQLNDIKINEQLKQAEILAAAQQEDAQRAERQAQNLERAAGDKALMAAIIAEYDMQEVLAEQIKQGQLTQVQEDAQKAREKLREIERKNAISVALGLGGQLMSLLQGHSKRAFEVAKTLALGSAAIEGYQSAVSAWKHGMLVGGPIVAGVFSAGSLLKTGALINSIRGTSFGGGGGSTASAGGGGDSGMASAGAGASAPAAAAPNAGSTMHVKGLDPSHLFTGSAMQTIAQGLLDYQKDGGKVVFVA